MLHIPVLVICTPACRNGGKCQWNPSSSTAECDCPVDTTGSYCQHKGTCNQGNACMLTTVEVHELPPCISFVQRSVTQVAKMEEFAIIVHIIFTISVIVPPALLDLTANTKVRATRNMHANNRWITKYAIVHRFHFAVTCSPTCRSGGICRVASSSAHCACPSGYSGSYCQYSGTCAMHT